MPIVINGSGSITGISAGGLPDGIIQAADLASGVGGKILQVKNVTKTDTFSSSLSQYVAASVTGMDLAFTASSTSNRLFFQVNLNICASTNNRPVAFFLVADGTKIDAATGDAAGSRYRSTATGLVDYTSTMETLQMNYYHTPTSTNSITYGVKIQNSHDSTNTLYVNRTHTDSDGQFFHRTISSMTIMEIAA
jgi:hypothetical protein